jgi:hypothetical protein
VEAWALRWSLLFQETVFSTTGIVNVERGSFNLAGETLFLTFYGRLTAWVEGTCSIRLRQGMDNNAELSGGVILRTLVSQDDSDYRSLVDFGGVGVFNPRHNMLAIYNPHFSVRLNAALGPGLTADFTYEVWGAAIALA